MANHRELWATRLGLILAMAGNAIGLGNFLRFPVQAAQHGGGAFLLPYFCALLLLGIPLMWVEWTMGRYGGHHGHGSTPGILGLFWRHPAAKYFGVLGILLPLVIVIYYNYIMSWTLAYAVFSLTGQYMGLLTREEMGEFLQSYQGLTTNGHFPGLWTAYGFFLLSTGLIIYILYRGVVRGIEALAKVAMPLLFIFAVILVARVFTLGTPDPAYPDRNVMNGFAFLWNPDFTKLTHGQVWLAAAGQIFFTLGVGAGVIHTYASYLQRREDVVLNGLTTAVTNEFAEVVLGASIAIPVAVAFFGAQETQAIAQGGSFNLGFMAMPVVLQQLPAGPLFGAAWFFLLFFAGITSAVALSQPAMAFLQDELGWTRHRAAAVVGAVLFLGAQPVIFFLGQGFLDELDFWAGTVGLALFALIEIVIFAWVFGMDQGWKEMSLGAQLKLPRLFYYILKYVTPLYILILLGAWLKQDGIDILLMKNVPPENVPFIWGARLLILALGAGIAVLVHVAWKKKEHRAK